MQQYKFSETPLLNLLNSKIIDLEAAKRYYNTLFISYVVTERTKMLFSLIKIRKYSNNTSLGVKKKLDRIVNIYNCEKNNGLGYRLYLDATETIITKKKMYCTSKYCSVCSYRKRIRQAKRIQKIIQKYKHPRFMNISFKNIEYLSDLKLISGQFRRFRRLLQQNNITLKSYVSVLEITNKGKGWHPHFHMIYDGDYIKDISYVRELLKKATDNISHHVYVEYIGSTSIRSTRNAAFYVSKYLSKDEFNNKFLMAEYFEGTKNTRFLKIYGTKDKKSKSFYELFSYIKKQWETEDTSLMYLDIFNKMSDHYLQIYDTRLSFEENQVKYFSHDSLITNGV